MLPKEGLVFISVGNIYNHYFLHSLMVCFTSQFSSSSSTANIVNMKLEYPAGRRDETVVEEFFGVKVSSSSYLSDISLFCRYVCMDFTITILRVQFREEIVASFYLLPNGFCLGS